MCTNIKLEIQHSGGFQARSKVIKVRLKELDLGSSRIGVRGFKFPRSVLSWNENPSPRININFSWKFIASYSANGAEIANELHSPPLN